MIVLLDILLRIIASMIWAVGVWAVIVISLLLWDKKYIVSYTALEELWEDYKKRPR